MTDGKVYYHCFEPLKAIPSPTPFGMKLETYLRMADISYEAVYGRRVGPKGRTPWIKYNGAAMGDSGLIIEFLNKEKGVDLNKNLSDTDRAVSRAFTKMIEENTYWGLVQYRWIDNFAQAGALFDVPLNGVTLLRNYKNKMKNNLWAHGLGRHSKDEIEAITEKDLKAVASLLGTKPYLMGDEPTEVDAAVFGQLSEILWTMPGSYLHRIVTQDCPNLHAYCNRIKDRYWSDWDQLTGKAKRDQSKL